MNRRCEDRQGGLESCLRYCSRVGVLTAPPSSPHNTIINISFHCHFRCASATYLHHPNSSLVDFVCRLWIKEVVVVVATMALREGLPPISVVGERVPGWLSMELEGVYDDYHSLHLALNDKVRLRLVILCVPWSRREE